MKNFLKKTLNKYYNFLEKKSVQKLIKVLMAIWVGLIFFLWAYYRDYGIYLSQFFFLFFLFILALNFIYRPKTKLNTKNFHSILKIFNIKQEYKIKLKNLFWLIPVFITFIAHTVTAPSILIENNLTISDLFFYELNIIQKIFLLALFYEILIIFVYGLGRKILKLFKFNFQSKLEFFLFSMGVGFIPLMLGTFLIAVLGLLYFSVILIFLFILFVISFKEIKQIIFEINKEVIELSFQTSKQIIHFIVVLILLTLLSLNFVAIIKPAPIDSDSMHTYFNAPNLFLEYHKYRTIPSMGYANMGQNQEMIYALILSILSPFFIIHIPLFFLVLSLFAFYFILKNKFGKAHASLAVLLIYLIPINQFLIDTVKVDLCLIFYLSLILSSLCLYKNKKKFIYLLGIFSGIAIGIKYNAVFFILPVFILLFFNVLRKGIIAKHYSGIKSNTPVSLFKNIIPSLKIVFIVGILAVLFFSPWMIKNIVYFQKPLNPYKYFSFKENNFKNYFYADKDFTNFVKNRSEEIQFLKHSNNVHNLSIFNFFKTLWNQSLGKDVLGDVSSNFGCFAILLFPFYFLTKKTKKALGLIFLSVLYFIFWYLSKAGGAWYALFGHMLLYTTLPLLLIQYRKIGFFILTVVLFTGLLHISFFSNELNYLIGKDSAQSYKGKTIPQYKMAKYINKLDLKNNEKMILVGDFKLAYIKQNDTLIKDLDVYFFKTGYNLNKGDKYFYDLLKKNNIHYIIFSDLYTVFQIWPTRHNITLYEYKQNYKKSNPSIYTDIERFNNFLKNYTNMEFDGGYYRLYKLK